jgi:uncharacterized protein YcfJ
MFKKIALAATALAIGTTSIASAPADAQRYRGYDRGYSRAYDDGYNHGPRSYRRDRGYSRRGGRGCDNTGGTLVGAIAGGLLGRTIDSRGDRTLGTVLGGAAGALAGHAIDKSDNPRYCR